MLFHKGENEVNVMFCYDLKKGHEMSFHEWRDAVEWLVPGRFNGFYRSKMMKNVTAACVTMSQEVFENFMENNPDLRVEQEHLGVKFVVGSFKTI